jgi:hypothetical protein
MGCLQIAVGEVAELWRTENYSRIKDIWEFLVPLCTIDDEKLVEEIHILQERLRLEVQQLVQHLVSQAQSLYDNTHASALADTDGTAAASLQAANALMEQYVRASRVLSKTPRLWGEHSTIAAMYAHMNASSTEHAEAVLARLNKTGQVPTMPEVAQVLLKLDSIAYYISAPEVRQTFVMFDWWNVCYDHAFVCCRFESMPTLPWAKCSRRF